MSAANSKSLAPLKSVIAPSLSLTTTTATTTVSTSRQPASDIRSFFGNDADGSDPDTPDGFQALPAARGGVHDYAAVSGPTPGAPDDSWPPPPPTYGSSSSSDAVARSSSSHPSAPRQPGRLRPL